MARHYSPSTRGFYSKNPPNDAVEVSDATYAALFAAQSDGTGKVIVPDSNGNPVAIVPDLSLDQMRVLLVALAVTALSKSDIVVIRCYNAAVSVPTDWTAYRSALRAIVNGSDSTSTSLPTPPSYPAGT